MVPNGKGRREEKEKEKEADHERVGLVPGQAVWVMTEKGHGVGQCSFLDLGYGCMGIHVKIVH